MKRYAWYVFGALAVCGTALAANVDKDFKKLDKNHDGYVSLKEAQQGDPLLARHFYRYDTAKTGELDRSEFAAYDSSSKDKVEPFILRHEWYGDYGTPGTDENN